MGNFFGDALGFGECIWNGMKIDGGNFAWDSNLNFGENMLAVASRFTWEAPQQFVGNLYNAFDSRGWDFSRNPLDPNGTGIPGQYWNFHDQNHRRTLNGLRIKSQWYDYTSPFFSGIYNTIRYNNP